MSSLRRRVYLYVKQFHELKPALSEVWDQIPGSCGSAQMRGVRAQTAEISVEYLLKWWKDKAAPQPTSERAQGDGSCSLPVPSEGLYYRQERIKCFSAIPLAKQRSCFI